MISAIQSPSDVDQVLKSWWQGDCVRGPQVLSYEINPSLPLDVRTKSALAGSTPGSIVEVDTIDGFMVLAQTCDIRRDCEQRPFMEVAPLVKALPPEDLTKGDPFDDVKNGHRPQFVTVPPLHNERLMADLDQVFTVEKAVVASWERVSGCSTDEERRILARHLGDKRGRSALPDEFYDFIDPLVRRLRHVRKKETIEGRTFRDLLEIRVQPDPDWYATQVTVQFWCILKDHADKLVDRSTLKADWLRRLPPRGCFVAGGLDFTNWEIMKVSTYFNADRVELERLSPS